MTQPSFLPVDKHNNSIKQMIFILIIIKLIISAIVIFYLAGASPRFDQPMTPSNMAVTAQAECPEGTTNQASKDGQPLCKLDPTGCPYGDTIPMSKCNAPEGESTTSHNIETVDKPVEDVYKGDNRAIPGGK